MDMMYFFPKMSAQEYNFKKLRHSLVNGRVLIITTLIFSCDRKTLATFCLQNTRPENAFLKATVNCRKIIQKNNLCHRKQQSIFCLMIYDVIQSILVLIKK